MAGPPTHLVLTEAQVVCLASSTRRDLFLALGRMGPSSAAELATAVGRAPDALYYHLNRLVQAGLVRSLGKRAATTRPEEIFEADQVLLTVDPANRAPSYVAARRKMTSSVIRTFAARLDEALESDDPERSSIVLQSHLVRLDDAAVEELDARLSGLAEFLQEHALTEGGIMRSVLLGRVSLDREDPGGD